MEYFVYILYSESLNKFYIGTTLDVEVRLTEHNSLQYKDAFTAKGVPWTLYLSIRCETSEQAYRLERFIKKMKSARFIRQLKEDPQMLTDVLKKMR